MIAVNRADTSLVLTLEDKEAGTAAVRSHGLASRFLCVLLGGTSFPAAEASGCAAPCWRLRSLPRAPPRSEQRGQRPRASLSRSELCSVTLEMSLKQWDMEIVR